MIHLIVRQIYYNCGVKSSQEASQLGNWFLKNRDCRSKAIQARYNVSCQHLTKSPDIISMLVFHISMLQMSN